MVSPALMAQNDTTTYEIDFVSHNQYMWKDAGFNLDFRKELFDESWNQSFGFDGTESILGYDFGLDFSAQTAGNIGMEFFLEDISMGMINTVRYPVKIEFVRPAGGSFNAGEKVVVTSSFEVQPGAKIITQYPNSGRMGLDFRFNMENDINMTACLFDCGSVGFSPDINMDMTLFQLSTHPGQTFYPGVSEVGPDGFLCYDPPGIYLPTMDTVDILPIEIVKDADDIDSTDTDSTKRISPFFSATLDLPYISGVSTTIDSPDQISATGQDTYITSDFDVIGTLFSFAPGYELNGELTAPLVGCFAALKYDFFNTDFLFDVTNKQEFTFNAKISAELHLPVEVEYQIKRDPNMVVESGKDSVITYRIGDRLEFIFPCEFEFVDFKPIFKLKNTFRNHTYDQYDLSVSLRALTFELEFKKVVIVPEYTFEICLPLIDCYEVTTPEVSFDPPDVGFGPLWEKTFPIGSIQNTWFDKTWELGGFDIFDNVDAFRLQPEPFNIDLTPDQILCHGDSTGSIELSETGATQPVSYKWSNSATTKNLNNVPAGDYYVKATDKNRCATYQGTTIHEPEPLSLSVTSENCLCYGDSTGAIYTEVEGGVPPYNYNWSNGITSDNNLNIPAGTYSLTVTDQNGCTIEDSVKISQPSKLNSYISDYGMPLCNSENNGYIHLNVSGGVEPYRYQWSNFMVTQNIDSLAAGNYSVTVIDDNGCITGSSVTIPEPPALGGELYVEEPISCYNGSDGKIAIDLTGGTPPYDINWYSPNYTLNQGSASISDLYEGTYQIEVFDSNDCYLKDTIYLESPDKPFYTDISTQNPSCYYSNDGALFLTVNNGQAPYSYQWSDGSTSRDLHGLNEGKYDVTVTDDLGCETSDNALLVAPDSIKSYVKIKEVSCIQESDGEIELTPYGGTPPYEINWDNGMSGKKIDGLSEGVYYATVVDSNDCSYQTSVEMTVNGQNCVDIPSAFTPNDDGINDTWVVRHLDLYPEHTVKIFTKWGSLIYEANGDAHLRPWDGTYKGEKMPAATYYYVVDLGNDEPVKKGLVTIVR